MVLQESPVLLALQIANFAINIIFLALFIYRFVVLRSFASTQQFKDYFPKLRIFFSMVYVVVNIALLVETVVFNLLEYTAVDMTLVVLGEGIDSVILFIQLLVLRLQLRKQQPYTRFHLAYFLYLCLFSAFRLTVFLLNERMQYDAVNIALSGVLIVDSVAQFTYWVLKKQSLPQFQVHTNAEIDSLRHQSKLIQNFLDADRSFRKPSEDTFPYILPFVSVDNGRIKVILEIASLSHLDPNDSECLPPNRTLLDSPTKAIDSLNRATRSQDTTNRELSRQILSASYYSIEEIKNLYVICSRFPMQKKLTFHFAPISLPEMARQLQEFLLELFRERRWYQPSVLKYLRIPLERLREYSEMVEKLSAFNKDTDLDQTLGFKVGEDKNAIFFSVSIYKHLWVDDHYEFYIKVVTRQTQLPYYPIKRFSEFEDFHNVLRQRIKSMEKDLQLPLLPKKHLFHWNEDQQVNQRRAELQRYLRLLTNDYTIVGVPALKELLFEFLGVDDEIGPEGVFEEEFYRQAEVVKGDVAKSLIRNDLVTYYEFKVFQRGMEVCSLSKRFSQFEELHHELERWMHNIQITYKAVALPERLYYKSEVIRHEKLKNYLQTVAEIRQVGRVYAVNSFFNIAGNAADDISEIGYNSRQMERSNNHSNNVINEVIELAETLERRPERLSQSSESSRRFSQIINNLGDTDFD